MKTIKGKYKRQAVRIGLLVVGGLVLLSIPQMTLTAEAQGHASHIRTYHGIANLAEKELRDAEREEKAKEDLLPVVNVEIANKEKGFIHGHNETTSEERTELEEHKYSY